MSPEKSPSLQGCLNWRVQDFCDGFGMGRTKFYSLVSEDKIRIVKCGRTSLIPDTEVRRFQTAIEAGEV